VHRFIVREYVYYNVLYVTHDSGSDDFLREGKRANTSMRARQEGEGRRREKDMNMYVRVLDGRRRMHRRVRGQYEHAVPSDVRRCTKRSTVEIAC
jgi:hypothetical protein